METAERLKVARRALARAEESVGLGMRVAGNGPGRDAVDPWRVPTGLETMFPRGLAPGMSIGIHGSRLATFLLAGVASAAGGWTAFLGYTDAGWGIASTLGVRLDRTVCVPSVGESARSQVFAAAIDGFEVVAFGASIRLDSRERKILAKRALTRGCLLLGEGWDLRERVVSRFLGASGMSHGAGYVSSLRLELSRFGVRRIFVIDSEGWRPAEGLRTVSAPRKETQRDGKSCEPEPSPGSFRRPTKSQRTSVREGSGNLAAVGARVSSASMGIGSQPAVPRGAAFRRADTAGAWIPHTSVASTHESAPTRDLRVVRP